MLSRLRPRLTFALAENQSFRGTLMTMGTVSNVSTGAFHTKRVWSSGCSGGSGYGLPS